MKKKAAPKKEVLIFFDHKEDLARVHKANPARKKAYDKLKPKFDAMTAEIEKKFKQKTKIK